MAWGISWKVATFADNLAVFPVLEPAMAQPVNELGIIFEKPYAAGIIQPKHHQKKSPLTPSTIVNFGVSLSFDETLVR